MCKNIGMSNIALKDLIRECSLNKKSSEQIYTDLSLMNRENIHKIFGYRKFNYDFSDYLSIYSNGEDLVNNIYPSYDDFLYNLLKILNIHGKGKAIDDESLTKIMKERIEILKNIKTQLDLKKEFPILYSDYIEGIKYINSFDKNDKKTESEQKYYYRCGLMKNFNKFINTQIELYERFIDRRFDYKKEITKNNYNKYIEENFDMNKLYMLLADQYLNICENTDDLLIIDRYIKQLNNYKNNEKIKKNFYIKNSQGIKIREFDINDRIFNLNYRLKALNKIDIKWEIAKHSNIKKAKNSKIRKTRLSEKEINKLKEKGKRKEDFYNKNKPLLTIKGINIQGYIARIYKNGEVILDKEYNENHPSTATGAAIHSFKVRDFEELSKLNTKELKSNPKSTWIEHRNNWEDKVLEIIEREATKEDITDIKQFIKKIKETT